MSWSDTVKSAHLAVTDQVSHYSRLKSERYFVWAEDSQNKLSAENSSAESAVQGTTDLYTKIEYDPWISEIERSFDNHGIAWYQNSTQYETDTGFIHVEWVWEVIDDSVY